MHESFKVYIWTLFKKYLRKVYFVFWLKRFLYLLQKKVSLLFCSSEKPWLLYGIIIGLSSGYALVMIGGIIYGLIKLGRWIRTKVSTFYEKRREQAEPTVLHLRQLQENLNQAWKLYLFHFYMTDKKCIMDISWFHALDFTRWHIYESQHKSSWEESKHVLEHLWFLYP